MIFTVINIGTGYLNRPILLLAGCSVYHRVTSQGFPSRVPSTQCLYYDRPAISALATVRAGRPEVFMTGPRPRSRRQQRCVRDARRDATDIEFFTSFYCITTIGQGLFEVCNIATGYAYESFSKVYCDRVYFLCAERFVTGSGFEPPAAPPTHLRGECPPPPPPRVSHP